MRKLRHWLAQLLEEDPGTVSSSRVILLATFLVCIVGPGVVAVVLSFRQGHLVDLPSGLLTFCRDSFAAACALKTVSKFAEAKTPTQ